MSNKRRGFTLIELLVVIAIIGILSAVVLASLNTARAKGSDAGVKADMDAIPVQSALYFDDHGQSYGTFDDGSGNPAVCPSPGTAGASLFNDPTIENAIKSSVQNSGGGTSRCVATPTSYAAWVSRPSGASSDAWCVDSIGVKCGVSSAAPITGGACTQPCVSSL